jgi:hypothetical protein
VVAAAAELFDPVSHTWKRTGSLNVAPGSMNAALLANGQVLVAGGENLASVSTTSAELYKPTTGSWKTTGSLGSGWVLASVATWPDQSQAVGLITLDSLSTRFRWCSLSISRTANKIIDAAAACV